MIINNNAVKMESNVEPTKALNFGISDVRLVVDILSKLYAYPIRTLVQEYICNGRDAMREAGTWGKVPMVIQIPNTLEPSFKVRDYGVGITPDRMENIFVNYGSSTKRNTNTQTGGFGIGAKSAFSYTDSFTITSFVNGTQYVYTAHLAESGGINLLGTFPTDEPNGVEISIGVKPKDIVEFSNAVQRCVKFWSESIKFVGSNVIFQLKPTLTLGNMAVYEEAHPARTIYLIDGIEYDLIGEDSTNYSSYWSRNRNHYLHSERNTIAINIDNGFFKIASSRERLENNDDNKDKQSSVLANANTLIDSLIASKINNTKLNFQVRINNKLVFSGFDKVKSTVLDLGNGFSLRNDLVFLPKAMYFRYCRRGRRGSLNYDTDDKTSFLIQDVVVYSSTEPDNTTARKLNYYLSSNTKKNLIKDSDIARIPNHDLIFRDRVDVSSLPLPPSKASQRKHKSTKDAVCWMIDSEGRRTQFTIEALNNFKSPVIMSDESTDELKAIAKFISVFIIPKCNKDLLLKRGMELDKAKEYLLSKHEKEILGIRFLINDKDKVKVLRKFDRKTNDLELEEYLVSVFPELKKKRDAILKDYESIVKKYPLIEVLIHLSAYATSMRNIVINELNKQSKES